jgi:hypothetical protein
MTGRPLRKSQEMSLRLLPIFHTAALCLLSALRGGEIQMQTGWGLRSGDVLSYLLREQVGGGGGWFGVRVCGGANFRSEAFGWLCYDISDMSSSVDESARAVDAFSLVATLLFKIAAIVLVRILLRASNYMLSPQWQ